jgi:hypothetical protein
LLEIVHFACNNNDNNNNNRSIDSSNQARAELEIDNTQIKLSHRHKRTTIKNMDNVVHNFNDELQTLLLSKPPVSKAKMGAITKAAMKGVKFYKHIVQIVEKFIARCRPEYKVPGLYVIDSIVRQSRHQFGPDRDVYAARFARNLGITFENLFSDCLNEDKARIVRVLNLWLKNGVFEAKVIQPLLDMAEPNFSRDPKSPSSGETNSGGNNLTTTKQQQEYNANNTQQQRYNAGGANSTTIAGGATTTTNQLKFTKNMLDFDYGEDDDDDNDETPTEAEPPLSSTLSKIEMEQRVKKRPPPPPTTNENSSGGTPKGTAANTPNSHQASSHKRSQPPKPPPAQDPVLERWNRILKGEATSDDATYGNNSHQVHQRSRSRSPAGRGGAGQLQASKSIDQHSRTSGSSRDGQQQQQQQAGESSKKVIDAERAAERERKCLPKIRDKHLTICSSTVWLGHVPKNVSEADISDAFGEFGTINSIDLIPPRGCAYVCMDRRQDAKRALSQSKRLKLNGSHIRMAWAPGKGLKEQKQWKDFWDSDIGASFVPYSKIDVESIDFDALEEGGVIDEDSMSMEMRDKREGRAYTAESSSATKNNETNDPLPDTQAAANPLPLFTQPPPPPPSSSAGMPFVIPPPPLNLGIPPPIQLLAQGLMSFPPPPPPLPTSSASNHNVPLLPLATANGSSQDHHHLPEQPKLNMIEQQLNMMQQAQATSMDQYGKLGAPPPLQHQSAAAFYPLNQPDPMVFDFQGQGQQHMMHMIPNAMDPHQMAMLEGHHQQQQQQQQVEPLLRPRLLPINQEQPQQQSGMSQLPVPTSLGHHQQTSSWPL